MGKITDAMIAILVLIVGLFILTKLGITWPGIWKMIHTFFSSSPSSNGTSPSVLFGMVGMAATNSKVRDKMKKRKEQLIRLSKIREIKGIINGRVNRRE